MTTEKVKRKLTAILSADVKGYSRLMGADEVGTIRILETYRGVISDLIQNKGGRVVDSPGDNVLAEFASVVDALESAVEIQKELKVRNADRSESRRMEFRIGINLGDVVEEAERIYGDGVNIAARIEGLAEGGGICISGTAFDHIGKRLPLGYEYMGEQEVKNIEKPVRVYRVLMEPEQAGKVIGEKRPKRTQWRWAAVAVAIVLVAGALSIWNFYFHPPPIEPASKEKMAFPLPDKPSIAVLPFVNMSDDPKQEFFSDGITEEIINALCKVPQIFVIARNSSFTYKGKPVKIQQVAQDLGVNYVLEGSVRREENRIRITAQLIDALTGRHIFSERYDRDLKEIFATQDEIAIKVLTALRVALTDGEIARLQGRGVTNIDVFFKLLEAHTLTQSMNKESSARARRLAEEALLLEPGSSRAYFLLATTHFIDFWVGPPKSHAESVAEGIAMAQKTIEMDPNNAAAYSLLGMLYVTKAEYDKAVEVAERGVSMDPNSVTAVYLYASTLMHASRCEEAIPIFEKAIRLSPLKPPLQCLVNLSSCYTYTYRYDEAVMLLKRVLQEQPNSFFANIGLTRVYAELDRVEDARTQAAHVLRLNPKFSLESFAKTWRVKDPAAIERYVNALRKAGLPDKPPLPLPEKPSIAVLPFVNMSEDKSQEFFSDGLTEEIINALVKLPQVFVIARNSSFTYKGKSVDVRQVGREMGVKYVLEGSVRREGERMRVTAQLVDTTTGNHLFSERYDREVKDLFALQDDITMKVMTAMRVQLTEGDYARASAKGTKNLEAYLKAMQSYQQRQVLTKEGQARARQLAEEAIALDPGYAMAYCHLAAALGNEAPMGVYKNVSEVLARSMELAQKAVALDDSLAQAHATLGFQYTLRRDFDRAIAEGERAVALEPNSAEIVASLAAMLEWADRPEEAISLLKKAMRLSPIPQPIWLLNMASAYIRMGQYEESIPVSKAVLQKQPDQKSAHIFLAIAYISTGREQEARAEAAEILRIDPQFSWERLARALPRKNQDEMNRRGELLRKAGLSE